MKLQTQIPFQSQTNNQIDYQSKLLLLGSCFVENIGDKFEYHKFQALQNPFGILFHPKAIENLISFALSEKNYSDEELFFHNEQWHCYDAHSNLSHSDKDAVLEKLNENLNLTSQRLKNASHIIITFGTAWVYKYFKSNLPVANCHKVDQEHFVKALLSVEEIVGSIKMMVNQIHQVNPKAAVIFTVSPIRHIKDGFVENTQSKAHLISAIHQFLNQQSTTSVQHSFYFPSYEIMMDELRDYRFYEEDMLHPSKTAINYIWEKFQQVWITSEAQKTMSEVEEIQRGIQHKPFNPNSEAHQQFLQKLELKKQSIQSKFPLMQF